MGEACKRKQYFNEMKCECNCIVHENVADNYVRKITFYNEHLGILAIRCFLYLIDFIL